MKLTSFVSFYARKVGPHYGVAAQGILRGLGLLYILAFWSVAAQMFALSAEGGLQPARAFYEYLQTQHGAWAPWIFPGLGWVSQSPAWMLTLCGVGVCAGLGLLYGFLPWFSSLLGWVCWISMMQLCQPWLNAAGDVLLAEMGLYALLLVPIKGFFYPRVEDMASRIPGILVMNLLLMRVLFLSGIARLSSDGGLWSDATALFYFFETQPLPSAGGWFLHQLPAGILRYVLWGWMFIELMLPWYTFLPRIFRNIFAGGVAVRSLLLLSTGQHGLYPWCCLILALSLVDDTSWRCLLPEAWGPSASRQQFRVSVVSALPLLVLAPMLLFQTAGIPSRTPPSPWSYVQQVLGHVMVTRSVPDSVQVPQRRLDLSLQGSPDGENWVEYRFWSKPTDPRRIPAAPMLHVPRLDSAFVSLARSDLLAQGKLPGWMLNLIQGLLTGDPRFDSLFPGTPFSESPPRYVRLVLFETRFADPVSRRQQGIWWQRKPMGIVGPIFSLTQTPSS